MKIELLLLVSLVCFSLASCLPENISTEPTTTPWPSLVSTPTKRTNCPSIVTFEFRENTGPQIYKNPEKFDYLRISSKDRDESLLERQESFVGTLTFEIEITGIAVQKIKNKPYHSILLRLQTTFRNTSSSPIIFFPEWFSSLGWDPFPLNFIVSNEEHWKKFPSSELINVSWDGNYPRSVQDLIIIEPKGLFSASYFTEGIGYIEDVTGNYYEVLPPGTYTVQANYNNINIGIPLGIEATPPPFDNSDEKEAWEHENFMYEDLNVWVGELHSNIVQFDIPTREELQVCINEFEN